MGKSKAAFLKHSANLRGAFLTLKEATVFRNKLLNLLSQSNNDGRATSVSALCFSLQLHGCKICHVSNAIWKKPFLICLEART